jgi:hypothetical protein
MNCQAWAQSEVCAPHDRGTRHAFPDLICQPAWTSASYLLFSPLRTTKTAFFIDNVKMEQR